MSVLSLERVAAIRADPERRTRLLEACGVDKSRPFLPEDQTQLYHTPAYRLLDREQRIRYNQLFALRVNEYIMMLERDFVEPVLDALRGRIARRGPPELLEALDAMHDEESLHYEAFAALNRQCEPEAYRRSDYWFMQLKPYERLTLRVMHAGARWLPFALWIIVAMEEYSIGLATSMRRAATTALGPLDPHFMAVHREHAKDEARHIHIDVHLIRTCLQGLPASWRHVNARLFMAFMRDMTAPKANGTGMRVVRRLIQEFPRLACHEAQFAADLVALRDDMTFQRSLFTRRSNPLAFELYDQEPAFIHLGAVIRGYERSAPTV